MSEIETRPPASRGRSSARGGRGGYGRGGPRGARKAVNGTAAASAPIDDSLDDQGELGEMKKKYTAELGMLRELFPDWTDVDLVFALQETDGDVPSTVERITEGNVSQFAEVKKTKDRARSKVKDDSTTPAATDPQAARSARGRGGLEGIRGGRARGSERGRGRGGLRGGRGSHATTNGTSKDAELTSVPTSESTAWADTAQGETVAGSWDASAPETAAGSWDVPAPEAAKEGGDDTGLGARSSATKPHVAPIASSEGIKSSLIPDSGPKKSWASMFSRPKPAPVPAKKAVALQPPAAHGAATELAPMSTASMQDEPKETQAEPITPVSHFPISEAALEPSPLEPPDSGDAGEANITPSKVPLTEENVEHLPDESNPPTTQTAASTTGSIDARNLTPLPGQQPAPNVRPPMGGYATSAYRAAGVPVRSASFQRRVKEQQEAVVMPGHNAVDRAAVQFGSMGLNSEPGLDVDEDREEPETRQPPQHSPPSQPRTSLPPVPRQPVTAQEMPDGLPTPKQAPGLPPASTQNQQQMQEAATAQGMTQDPGQLNPNYNQYGRYGQPGMQPEPTAQQKQYDPFGHQAQPGQYDQFASSAPPQQAQQQAQAGHSGFGGLSSAPNDYSAYYTSDQSRNAYNQYYGSSYGQQDSRGQLGQVQQDAGVGQQRSGSAFGAGPNDSAFSAQAQQQAQSRFGDTPGSGHNTPNPLMGGQHQSGPQQMQSQQHSMHQGPGNQPQPQQGGYPPGASAAFPYGHPYYNSPYQAAYQNQFGYGHQPAGYSGSQGYQGKQGNMYGMPHGYSMGSQSSYEQHSSSPASASGFGQNQQGSMRSASGVGSGLAGGLDDYGRASAQPGSHQQSGGFAGANDPFARSASGFGSQAGYGQQGAAANPEDSLKPFNDPKGGPSPALGQPGRPGSAANNGAGSQQSGLPQAQAQQAGFGGGYQGSQYGGLGGLGNHQQQGQGTMGGQGGYGGYSAGGFNQTYGGYGSRGGWGSNYGAH